MVAEFRQRRDVIVKGLNAIEGITCVQPRGAFYVFPSVRAFGIPSQKIEEHLLQRAGVAVLSGTAFGRYGEGYLRFSYANSVQAIRGALEAVAAVLPELEAWR
jgi:aspartate/methionine/tyrosine aminotransferase